MAFARMTYLQHLEELRRRLIVCFLALCLGVGACWFFAWNILAILKHPAGNITLNYLTPLEPFVVKFKLALWGGILLCMPVILFEVLGFLAPALKKKEMAATIGILAMIIIFFAAGITFGYFYVMPVGISWLLGIAENELRPVLTAGQYISFCGWFLIAFGFSFETPMFIWLLVRMGVVTPEQLRQNWRIAYIIILLFAAIVTPDWNPITMVLVAVPMIALYELSILLAKVAVRRMERVEGEEEEAA